jgi:hypothetical protein
MRHEGSDDEGEDHVFSFPDHAPSPASAAAASSSSPTESAQTLQTLKQQRDDSYQRLTALDAEDTRKQAQIAASITAAREAERMKQSRVVALEAERERVEARLQAQKQQLNDLTMDREQKERDGEAQRAGAVTRRSTLEREVEATNQAYVRECQRAQDRLANYQEEVARKRAHVDGLLAKVKQEEDAVATLRQATQASAASPAASAARSEDVKPALADIDQASDNTQATQSSSESKGADDGRVRKSMKRRPRFRHPSVDQGSAPQQSNEPAAVAAVASASTAASSTTPTSQTSQAQPRKVVPPHVATSVSRTVKRVEYHLGRLEGDHSLPVPLLFYCIDAFRHRQRWSQCQVQETYPNELGKAAFYFREYEVTEEDNYRGAYCVVRRTHAGEPANGHHCKRCVYRMREPMKRALEPYLSRLYAIMDDRVLSKRSPSDRSDDEAPPATAPLSSSASSTAAQQHEDNSASSGTTSASASASASSSTNSSPASLAAQKRKRDRNGWFLPVD